MSDKKKDLIVSEKYNIHNYEMKTKGGTQVIYTLPNGVRFAIEYSSIMKDRKSRFSVEHIYKYFNQRDFSDKNILELQFVYEEVFRNK